MHGSGQTGPLPNMFLDMHIPWGYIKIKLIFPSLALQSFLLHKGESTPHTVKPLITEDHVGKMVMLLGRRVAGMDRMAAVNTENVIANGRGVEMMEAKERTHILSPIPLQS